jgi:flagellar basal body-associated protein FliL
MTGNPLIDKIVLGLNALVSMLIAGLMYYYANVHQKPLPENTAMTEEMKKDIEDKSMTFSALEMNGTIVNLRSRTSRLRFLDLDMQLVPSPPFKVEDLKTHNVVIKDIVINVASQMTDEELATVSGKILLEGRIKKETELFFKRPSLEKIIFTKYVIQ